ncbi:MAG: hypothetical protein HZA22_11600 [Nitrospirae bacterium]|nr:hypothetical protein [Nitrospirota bacterium]MBI5696362.1 hypothetical protein [Nitrospirota bacterium]
MYTDNLAAMIGQAVEVESDGMTYRGTLVEVSETDVFLQSDVGWIQLSVETVRSIKPRE